MGSMSPWSSVTMAEPSSDATADALSTQASASIKSIRDVAKWLITAFAAVAGVMIAGSQLSDIGALDVGYRLLLAALGGVAALSGVAWAIWSLTEVMLPEETTIQTVLAEAANSRSALANRLAIGSELLVGFPSAVVLNTKYQAERHRQADAQQRVDATPDDQIALQELESATGEAEELAAALSRLATLTAYYRQREEFKNRRKWLYVAGLLTALGIGVFAWAANPPDEQTGQAPVTPTPALAAPARVRVTLNPFGRETLAPLLGAACADQAAAGGVDAYAIGATASDVDIMIVPTARCDRAVRFTLALTQGVATPAEIVTPPTPTPSRT
jgi:hypothetical protein